MHELRMESLQLVNPQLTKNELYDLLWVHGKTYTDIGLMYNLSPRKISKLSKDYNIPKNYKAISHNANKSKVKNFTKEELNYYYNDLKLSTREIAEKLNSSHGVILDYMKKYNITRRSNHDPIYYINRNPKSFNRTIDSQGYVLIDKVREHRIVMEKFLQRKLTDTEYVHHVDFNKTNNDINNLYLFNANELHLFYHGYINNNEYIPPNEFVEYYHTVLDGKINNCEWLYNQYITNNKSVKQIADELKLSRNVIKNRLEKYNIYSLRKPTVNQFL